MCLMGFVEYKLTPTSHNAKEGFVNTFDFMQTEDFGMHFLLYAMLACALASGFETVSVW